MPYGLPELLLVTEGFDGVEAGGFPGRVDAEPDADGGAEHERGDEPENRELGGHVRAIFHKQRKACAENHAENSADGSECDGFNQELKKYVAAFCPNGFAHANFARALCDADEHDVHHTNSADEQADGGDAEHEQENQEADFVPEIEEIVRSENGEIVWFIVRQAAFAPKQVAHFFDGLRNLGRVAGL